MSRYARGSTRKREPNVRKVREFELSNDPKRIKWQTILFLIMLFIGVFFIAIGVKSLFTTESGWQRVTLRASAEHFDSFEMYYDYTDLSKSEQNAISDIFSLATVELYNQFSTSCRSGALGGIAEINKHPNEAVEVGDELYRALELLSADDNRILYAGPLHEYHESLLIAESDLSAAAYDPMRSAALSTFFDGVARYVGDSGSVSLELCADNKVILHVSDGYQSFAAENDLAVDGIVPYISFGYLKNAFVIDCIADRMLAAGYDRCYINSADGFSRLLDPRGEEFAMSLVYRDGGSIVDSGSVFVYDRPMAISVLRSYPMTGSSMTGWYYIYEDGSIATPYIDASGREHCAVPELISYRQGGSCAELLLSQLKVYLSDDFSADRLAAMQERGISSIYVSDGKIISTDRYAQIRAAD